MSERRAHGVRWVVAVALLVAFAWSEWPRLRSESAGVDYYQFWIVGQARELGAAEPYSDAGRERLAELGRRLAAALTHGTNRLRICADYRATIESFGTPFLYALVSAGSSGSYDTDLRRFQTLSIAAFVAGVAALCALAGYRLETALALAVLVSWLCEPLASDVHTGNVGELQIGGVALLLALRRRSGGTARELAAGAVLGLLVCLKPTLGAIAPFLFCVWGTDRRWRSLALVSGGAALGTAAALALGAHFLGSWQSWLDWARALGALERVSDLSVARGNFSLAQWVLEVSGRRIALGLTLALGAAVAARIAWTRAPAADDDARFERELFAVAFGCALAALSLQLVWLHYLVLLAPLLLLELRPGAARWRSWSTIPTLLAALALLGRPLRELAGVTNPDVQAPVYVVAAWLAAGIGIARAPRGISASVR
jgi:glycosyl transferase family 87